jgi:aspartyl-tRNA(Asn)/glutamyl-tRNA(Gln) amidotransferase subunit A
MAGQWLPIVDLAQQVQAGSLTAGELVERSLNAIDEAKDYQAIIAITPERAKERAKDIDEKVKKGEKTGRLAGVPFIAKDNFLVFGAETTAASNILKGFTAPYQATVINRLEDEGAICVAKANLDAFGHGASTENSDFFVTKNPHNKTRVPGGSSGGSAAAVVLNLAPFALGTDSGGSSRQPASFCGCVGYKPTYGLMSRSGIVAMASSTDTVGILTNNIKDLALTLDVMAGRDPLDSTTIDRQDDYTNLVEDQTPARIGLIKEWLEDGVDKDVKRQIERAVEVLRGVGYTVEEVSISSLPLSLAAYYVLVPAEISSNLSRYDGQRFGYSFSGAKNLEESYRKSREFGFGKEAKRRIMMGTYVLSSGYYDAYYKKAQIVRTKLISEFTDAFKKYDFLVGPVTPTTAFPIGEKGDPLAMYMCDIMTVAASIVGCPSISVPAGVDDQNLPVGLQLLAPQRADKELLGLARYVEELLS